MIDIKALEKDEDGYRERYRENLKNRGDSPESVDQLLDLNQTRKTLISEFEEARAQQKKVGQEIALKKKNKDDATSLLDEMQALSQKLKDMEKSMADADEAVKDLLLRLPNLCDPDVPVGQSEEDNKVLRTIGEAPKFSFTALEHSELGEALDIIDFERAGRVTGSRFAFLKKAGAQMERALIQFMLDVHTREHGYEEMLPPFIVNSRSLTGTGQFPKFQQDVFGLAGTDYYLVPTAEVPVTNYYYDEILDETQLPQSFVAYTPCFRSEAGSYGRDTKGLIRQHQFNKVELMKFAHPENSEEEHERLTNHAENILKKLELSYRVASLSTGDIGFGAAKCYDIEVWLPGQNAYREISSCSNFRDFQARRANIRFRSSGGKPQYVHTLNGSGLAVGRTLIAILENYQTSEGTIAIPEVLQPYMGGAKTITR
ncbi:MAG: serine--tRNA ligase [Pseudobdellovibrionaceae bacterium]|nr:serine--tRNA ligase [Bdellovibrionales bacterium]USN46793.1 MAG: serine--tRNA ligase [Pseudobdellovibrionaceae bacterium]